MNDLDLSARLHVLADDLGGPHDEIAPESVIALYRRRRRTRAGLIATVAAVVAVAVGVPTAVGSLSSGGEVAVPTPSVSTSSVTPSTARTPKGAMPTTAPTRSTRPADTSPEPEHVSELERVAAELPPLALTAPELWDQWLPEGRPYPQASIDEDALTCPRLSAPLAEVIGQDMSYWTGTLPGYGCSWVETPLDPDHADYQYVVTVGFTADGTTVDEFRRLREGPGQGTHHCPWVDLPSVASGSLLVRCAGPGSTSYTLAVPDTRVEGGLWVLSVNADDAEAVRPTAILPVLVDGIAAEFG